MSEGRVIHVIHFNDIYNIEPSNKEPVGGAAKFVHQVFHPAPPAKNLPLSLDSEAGYGAAYTRYALLTQ
jgi:hypothetical protein